MASGLYSRSRESCIVADHYPVIASDCIATDAPLQSAKEANVNFDLSRDLETPHANVKES